MTNNSVYYEMTDELKKKYESNIEEPPFLFPQILMSIIKNPNIKKIDFSKIKNEKKFLSYVFTIFKKYFWENEAIFSLKYYLFAPFLMKENGGHYYAVPMKKNKSDKMSLRVSEVFALHNKKTKDFIWLNPNLIKNLSENGLKSAQFTQYELLQNVSVEEGQNLAVWFRLEFYKSGLEIHYKKPNKIMKTHNLVVFEIENKDIGNTIVYSLVDLGVKDSSHKNIQPAISIYNSLFSMTNDTSKGGSKIFTHKHSSKEKYKYTENQLKKVKQLLSSNKINNK